MNIDNIIKKVNERGFITTLNNIGIEELYYLLMNYVDENFLDFDGVFYFKFGDSIYECGIIYGPEVVYYVRKNNNVKHFIDYNDLINNSISDEQKVIRDTFENIKQSISFLKEKGVSMKLIKKNIN